MSLTGCSTGVSLKETSVEYPYRIEANTLTNVGHFEAVLKDSKTFSVGLDTYIEEGGKIKEIQLPKKSKDTKENFNDNIINLENLNKWMASEDIKYEMYSGSLEKARVYLDIINKIEEIDFGVEKGAYVKKDKETLLFDGAECKVIRTEASGELAAGISLALGGDGVPHIESSEKPVMFITYYIDGEENLRYVGVEASEYMGRTGMRLEIYKESGLEQ